MKPGLLLAVLNKFLALATWRTIWHSIFLWPNAVSGKGTKVVATTINADSLTSKNIAWWVDFDLWTSGILTKANPMTKNNMPRHIIKKYRLHILKNKIKSKTNFTIYIVPKCRRHPNNVWKDERKSFLFSVYQSRKDWIYNTFPPWQQQCMEIYWQQLKPIIFILFFSRLIGNSNRSVFTSGTCMLSSSTLSWAGFFPLKMIDLVDDGVISQWYL